VFRGGALYQKKRGPAQRCPPPVSPASKRMLWGNREVAGSGHFAGAKVRPGKHRNRIRSHHDLRNRVPRAIPSATHFAVRAEPLQRRSTGSRHTNSRLSLRGQLRQKRVPSSRRFQYCFPFTRHFVILPRRPLLSIGARLRLPLRVDPIVPLKPPQRRIYCSARQPGHFHDAEAVLSM